MIRDLGVSAWLAEALGPLVVLFALLTQLGDLWFLALLVVGSYWLGAATPWVGHGVDRRRAATVVALLLGYLALITVLKPLFGLPRPPDAGVAPRADLVPAALEGVYAWLSTGDGFGFPSGHALGTTLVYGGLAWALRVGERRRRVALAAVLVALASLSRLVLGLHYLPDVVAGAALGLGYLGAVLALGTPRRAFALAAGVALAGLPLVGPGVELASAAGACLGAAAAWTVWGDRVLATPATRRGGLLTVGVGALTAGPLLAVASRELLSAWPSLAVGVVGGALVMALPLAGERVAKR